LVGDSITGGRPDGADAVVGFAEVADEQPLVGAVGVDQPEFSSGLSAPV
jgi:hypothetical protein